ncbi:MAG: hypothetical protein AAF928_18660 [Myxococcota bacterium]
MVYAVGGGHGHAVRGAGVASALVRRGVATSLVVLEAQQHLVEALAPEVPLLVVAGRDHTRLPGDVTRELLAADRLVVDTFPGGVRGELQGLSTPRWAMLRLRRDAETPAFLGEVAACEAAVDLECNLRWLEHADVTALDPVARNVLADPDARDDGSVCLLSGGDPALDAFFDKLGPRLRAVGLSVLRRAPASPPLMFDRRPRVVVGAAGYNLTYELARAGIHHLAIPRARPFDDQRRRARAIAEAPADPEAMEARIIQLALDPDPGPPRRRCTGRYDDVAAWLLS